jgi:hypothetical protein
MMVPPQAIHALDKQHGLSASDCLAISDSTLSLGLLLLGSPGSGKTTYEALLALQLLRRGYPTVCLDPTGSLSEALIFLLLRYLRHVPPEKRAAFWQRLRFIEVGNQHVVTSFPIYYRTRRKACGRSRSGSLKPFAQRTPTWSPRHPLPGQASGWSESMPAWSWQH